MSHRRGKAFEVEIHKLFKYKVPWMYRPLDSVPGRQPRFTYINPIDLYGMDSNGAALVIECKALNIKHGKSLPFSRLISRKEDRRRGSWSSFKQWGALYRCAKTDLATVWIALNVYGQPGKHGNRGEAYLIPFGRFVELRIGYRGVRKSWPLDELLDSKTVIQLDKIAGGWNLPSSDQET